jgi:hypothetical protein
MKITFSQPEGNRKDGRPRFGIKTPSDLGNEHMVKKSAICGVKSSGRTRHMRGCSTKKEYQHSQRTLSIVTNIQNTHVLGATCFCPLMNC